MSSAMRGLVQRISLGNHSQPVRIITFIASRPREGTSTMARNYAAALASQTNQKVLLIDAGPYAAERFKSFGVEATGGIVDAAINGHLPTENTQPLDKNISVGRWLSNEIHPGSAGKVMHNHTFWKNLLDSYDSLVIDAPSLRSTFDGVAVAAKSDATVIVVESEKTPQPVVEHLRDTLLAAGAKTAGVVMNKRRYYIPGRVYKNL